MGLVGSFLCLPNAALHFRLKRSGLLGLAHVHLGTRLCRSLARREYARWSVTSKKCVREPTASESSSSFTCRNDGLISRRKSSLPTSFGAPSFHLETSSASKCLSHAPLQTRREDPASNSDEPHRAQIVASSSLKLRNALRVDAGC